jgi:hypothetical protein
MSTRSLPQTCLPDAALRTFLATPRGAQCAGWLDAASAMQLLQSVYVACSENLRSAHAGQKYLARELCGDPFWSARRRREQICAGICLVYLVDEIQALPLRLHKTKSGKGSKRYWLQRPTAGISPLDVNLTTKKNVHKCDGLQQR